MKQESQNPVLGKKNQPGGLDSLTEKHLRRFQHKSQCWLGRLVVLTSGMILMVPQSGSQYLPGLRANEASLKITSHSHKRKALSQVQQLQPSAAHPCRTTPNRICNFTRRGKKKELGAKRQIKRNKVKQSITECPEGGSVAVLVRNPRSIYI